LQNPLTGDLSPTGFEQSDEKENENVAHGVEFRQASPRQRAKPVTKDKRGAKSDEEGIKANEKGKRSGEEEAEAKEKKAKVLEFKKFDIPELDCIFSDFKTTFDPFVQNREEMSKAEDSFKKAVMSLEQISPRAKFGEYVAALKTRLKTEGITVKVKEGAATIYQEGKKTVKGISDAVTAINAMLKLAKDLKAMPLTIANGSEDAVERADELDVQGILKRELKSMWDLGKIPKLKRAFSNNVKQVKRAPEMVRDFASKPRRSFLKFITPLLMKKIREKWKRSCLRGMILQKTRRKRRKARLEIVIRRKKARKRRTRKTKIKKNFIRSLSLSHLGLMISTTCSHPSRPQSIPSWKRASAFKLRENPLRIL